MTTRIRRAWEMVGGIRAGRELGEHDTWDRGSVLDYQEGRLRLILGAAAAGTSFYRNLYRGVDVAAAPLRELPPVTKGDLMAHFDDAVTDPALTLKLVRQHGAGLRGDELLLGRYRVVATGGTSGQRGWFVYDRQYWQSVLARQVRTGRWIGFAPTFPRRTAMASISGVEPIHVSGRMMAGTDVGLFRMARLSATQPVPELVAALNAFGPEVISCYPTIGAVLAAEQLDGRLRINPRIVFCGAETLTNDLRERMEQAWDVQVRNLYGATEVGTIGIDCERRQGLHIFEDAAIVESVAADGSPVPDGEVGDHVLVTNLWNRTQPIIRYALDDRLAITTEPCACGLPYARILDVDGRADDLLSLPTASGTATVHPRVFRDVLGRAADVVEYQVRREPRRLEIDVVTRAGTQPGTTMKLAGAVESALRPLGVEVPVAVTEVERIERTAGSGKFRLVRDNTVSRAVALGLLVVTAILLLTGRPAAAAVELSPQPSSVCLSPAASPVDLGKLSALLCPGSPADAPYLPYEPGEPADSASEADDEAAGQPTLSGATGLADAKAGPGIEEASPPPGVPEPGIEAAIELAAVDLPATPSPELPAEGPGYRLMCSLGGAALAATALGLRGARRAAHARLWAGRRDPCDNRGRGGHRSESAGFDDDVRRTRSGAGGGGGFGRTSPIGDRRRSGRHRQDAARRRAGPRHGERRIRRVVRGAGIHID